MALQNKTIHFENKRMGAGGFLRLTVVWFCVLKTHEVVKCVNCILKLALWFSFIKKKYSFYNSKTSLWSFTEHRNCGWSGCSRRIKNKMNQGEHTWMVPYSQNLKGLHSFKYLNDLNGLRRVWLSLYLYALLIYGFSWLKWFLHCKPM